MQSFDYSSKKATAYCHGRIKEVFSVYFLYTFYILSV